MFKSVALVLVFCSFLSEVYCNGIIRKTTNGWIRGLKERSRSNSSIEYYAFKGIPYGRPPLGKLRFQDPQPAEPWNGVRNATKTAERCVQFNEEGQGPDPIGSEDCLYLDVYVPITAKKSGERLPVMFWIHGGNFVFLTYQVYAPDYFMEKPVVIVEIEYRLNVFGFLSTLDSNARGNAGLKDQVLALEWVRENIANFDGDSSLVTIFGESAGGASVIYHMLSPMSRGLFSRAISQSGSPLNRWALQREPIDKIMRLAKGLGINSTDTKEIVERLQDVDSDTLLKAAFNKSIVGFYTPHDIQPFSAMIEKSSNAAFISESPYRALKDGRFAKVPFMLGVNTEEGSDAYDFIVGGQTDINIYQRHPELLLPPLLMTASKCIDRTLENVTKRYFPDRNYTNKYEWIPYQSFDDIVTNVLITKENVYKQTPTYFYVFSYVGSRTEGYLGGVAHSEELHYLWYPHNYIVSPIESTNDTFVRKRMVTLWTNFATTGQPTPNQNEALQNIEWPLVDANNKYLDIGFELSVKQGPYEDDYRFWMDEYEACGFS